MAPAETSAAPLNPWLKHSRNFTTQWLTLISAQKTKVALVATITGEHMLNSSLAVCELFLLPGQAPCPVGSLPPGAHNSHTWPLLTALKLRVVLDWTGQTGLTWSSWNRLSCREGGASAGICKTAEGSILAPGKQLSSNRENAVLSKSEINLAAMRDVSSFGDWIHLCLLTVFKEGRLGCSFYSTGIMELSWESSCILPPIRGSSRVGSWEQSHGTAEYRHGNNTFRETTLPYPVTLPEQDKAALLSTISHSEK